MAKRMTKPMPASAPSNTRLTIPLFGPGMSVLHRAGLGGLACSLRAVEREFQAGRWPEEDLPGGPWADQHPPWALNPQELTIDFGEPQKAGEFLKKVFAFAFRLSDGLIFLPGQYPEKAPPLEVRAYLQQGIVLTFLQHGRVRQIAKQETQYQYQPDDSGKAPVTMQFKQCNGYKHQSGWSDLVDRSGQVRTGPIEVVGPMNPGAVVRHNAYAAQTKIEDDAPRILSLYFAMVGCLALPINRGSGVLLVPEVTDLIQFSSARPWMTPTSTHDCQITSAGDAALQALIRLRAHREIEDLDLPGCYAVTFRPTPWASQQKSRVQTFSVARGAELELDQFDRAWHLLGPRLVSRKVSESAGKGKQQRKPERTERFWVDSVVRPLAADNLAQARPWYQGFSSLMIKVDPANNRPIRDRLVFEKKGLHDMIEQIEWKEQGEAAIVRAVHEAMRRRFGQIYDENKTNPAALKNRWKGEYDRWRLAFAGSKTPDQFRRFLCDLFSRAGSNPVLQQQWRELLPMLSADRWQLTRDLALLGLASYAGRGAKEIEAAAGAADASVETETE
jgi:CRISPR-associated protein Cas8a1/Csx13